MFYTNSVNDTRKVFYDSWHKHLHKKPLLALEQQIVAVIIDHPEYHALLQSNSFEQAPSYYPELGHTNPFLHMGLHLAIRDQVITDRPAGIKAVFKQLLAKKDSSLIVEHLLMDRLAETLWRAQRDQVAPDDEAYLAECQALL